MKIKFPKSLVLESTRHCGVVVSTLVLLISIGLITGLAQSKAQKRITSLQLGDTPQGTRVTVVSDSALNDYEAFRRDDRFYVKIPAANFTAAQRRLRGDGFEDSQVQKSGDSILISFKLQPGASAHVEQAANRLDVLFSSLARSRTTKPIMSGAGEDTNRTERRIAAAGPTPPMSFPTATPPTAAAVTSSSQPNSRSAPSPTASIVTAANPSNASSTMPGSVSTPSVRQPSVISVGTSGSGRTGTLKAWAKQNRFALLIGGLALLAVAASLFMWHRKREQAVSRKTSPTRARKHALVEPKLTMEYVTSSKAVEAAAPTSAISVSSIPAGGAWLPQRTSPSYSTAVEYDSRGEDQEREVFEL